MLLTADNPFHWNILIMSNSPPMHCLLNIWEYRNILGIWISPIGASLCHLPLCSNWFSVLRVGGAGTQLHFIFFTYQRYVFSVNAHHMWSQLCDFPYRWFLKIQFIGIFKWWNICVFHNFLCRPSKVHLNRGLSCFSFRSCFLKSTSWQVGAWRVLMWGHPWPVFTRPKSRARTSR